MALILSKMTFAIGTGIVSQLAVLASDVYGGGDGARGILIAARGVGVGLGPLIAMKYTGSDLSRVLKVCGLSSLGFCVCYLIGIWQPYLAVAVVFVTLGHLGGGAQWTLSSFGVQMRSPDEMRGRIIAGDFAMMTMVMSVTTTVVGILSDTIGVRPAMSIFAAAAAVASVVYLNATRPLRRELAASRE